MPTGTAVVKRHREPVEHGSPSKKNKGRPHSHHRFSLRSLAGSLKEIEDDIQSQSGMHFLALHCIGMPWHQLLLCRIADATS